MARPRPRTAVTASVALLAAIACAGHQWTAAEGARILAVETVAARSHWNFMSAVLRSLTAAGHQVTAFTPFPDEGGGGVNYTAVDTSAQCQMLTATDPALMVASFGGPVALMRTLPAFCQNHCDVVMRHPRFDAIMRNQNAPAAGVAPFDLVIMEPLAVDCMSHVAHTLSLPIVYAIPSPMITYAEREFTGHVSHPACVSNLIAGHAVPRTFVQRFTNNMLLVYTMVVREFRNRLLRFTDPRPYDASPVVRPSVIFQNSFHGTEAPRPVLPNVVDVGGIHLEPAKTIPAVGIFRIISSSVRRQISGSRHFLSPSGTKHHFLTPQEERVLMKNAPIVEN
uniref:UDP-glucuronosyltransferase 2C1 n=1 Tax=Sipha flava TaxID=143950 RepID=A0A2S2QWQ3_9HEMI